MSKVLLVADADDQNRNMISSLVHIFGYQTVMEAKDGFEALERIQNQAPDIAIIDLALPKLNGYFLSEILHYIPRFHRISIALMAPQIQPENIQKGMSYGVHAFIEKPVSADSIKRLLSASQIQQDLLPKEASASMQIVLQALENGIKQTLTLLFGLGARLMAIHHPQADEIQKVHDVVGFLDCGGNTHLQIAVGFSESTGKQLCASLGKKVDHLDAIARAAMELLQSIYQRSSRKITEIGASQPAPPQIKFKSIIPLDKTKETFGLQFRVLQQSPILRKHFTLTFYASIQQIP